jgi:predicted RNase H-like HicB family nuclease
MGKRAREFYVVIERDEDGYYVGEVPQLRACYSQGRTLEELLENIREVIQICLEEGEEPSAEFIGLQKVIIE